ncbi:MAG: PfkB family carbohydrate kinase [Bacillota bacterium]
MKLNTNEEKVLEILKKNPFIDQKSIAKELSISRPAIANLISGLQDKGLILGKPYLLRQEKYVTCIGAAHVDYTFKLEEDMVLGTSNPVNSQLSYGGVARNIAENLMRLDHNVSLMSVVGDDFLGNELIDSTRKYMKVFATEKIADKTTGSYYSIIKQDGNMAIGFANMNIYNNMNRDWILSHKQHLNLGEWIIADTNITKDAMDSLIEFSLNTNKKLAIIGVSIPKMNNIPEDLKGVEIIVCNLAETKSYFNTNQDNLAELSQLWLNKGVRKVVITAGEEGCIYAFKNTKKIQKALMVPEKKIKNVTGAGDAFSAALLSGLIKRETFETSVKLATISAALTIQSKEVVNLKLSTKLLLKELNKNENK